MLLSLGLRRVWRSLPSSLRPIIQNGAPGRKKKRNVVIRRDLVQRGFPFPKYFTSNDDLLHNDWKTVNVACLRPSWDDDMISHCGLTQVLRSTPKQVWKNQMARLISDSPGRNAIQWCLSFTWYVKIAAGVLVGVNGWQTKVGDLEHPSAVDDAVAWFQVAMVLERRVMQVAHSL